jgi:hypothetical protein
MTFSQMLYCLYISSSYIGYIFVNENESIIIAMIPLNLHFLLNAKSKFFQVIMIVDHSLAPFVLTCQVSDTTAV